MADSKISALTALTSADPTDVLPIVDVSAGVTKKITKTALLTPAQKTIDDTDSPYTVLATDETIFCDTTTADIIVNIPQAVGFAGRVLIIKKIDGGGNRVNIHPFSGDNLEDTSMDIQMSSPYEGNQIQSDGGIDWWVIAKTV